MKLRHFVLTVSVVMAALLWATTGSAQAPTSSTAEFSFKTDVLLGLSGYVLPPGQYMLKREAGTLFRLYREKMTAKPTSS
jgi:hypothetical protein